MFSGKFRFLSICINCHILCNIPKFLCLMKCKISVSDNSNLFSSVKEGITNCTITDSSTLKLPESRNLRSISLSACCQNDTDCIKIPGCRLYCKSVKTTDSQDFCLYNADT